MWALVDERRREFQSRRDQLVEGLRALGFGVPVVPDGAFYVYADSTRFGADSMDVALRLIERAEVV